MDITATTTDISATATSTAILHLPTDTLHLIFSHLPLRHLLLLRSVCKHFNTILTTATISAHLHPNPLPLLALRPPHRHPTTVPSAVLHSFDPTHHHWLRFPLSFLPFPSLQPIASSLGLVYLWAHHDAPNSSKLIVVCNPLNRAYAMLPQLGSAWSRHGSVLVGSEGRREILILTQLATLSYCIRTDAWLKFSSNLPSKPRSPVLVGGRVLTLCDVGTPWRSQWKLFSSLVRPTETFQSWNPLERQEWGDVFDILKRPRLLKGDGDSVFMIGGLKSSFAVNAVCSTILVLRLELETMEWGEAGRMPGEMFKLFSDSSKFKVFGEGNRVCFSAKRVGKLALLEFGEERKGEWRWVDGVPGNGDGLYRGFLFDARLDALP